MAEEAIRSTATGYNDSLKNLVALYKGYSDFENSGFYTGLNDIQIMQKKKWDNASEKWLTELPYRTGTYVREYMPYQYIETGIQDKLYLKIGMILGKLTGFIKDDFITTYYEVRLFNPYWDFSGEPNYYIFVRKEALDLKVDNGTVKGVVWREYVPRERVRIAGGDYPHVDITYKTLCWDKDFTSLGHWNRTDTYFGNMDWLKAVTGVDGTVGDYNGPVYYGDNYDYRAGKKFTGIYYGKSSGDNNTIKPSVASTTTDSITMKSATALWNGQPIKRCGYICKEDLLTSLEMDINTPNIKIANNWERNFLLPTTIVGLAPGTNYTIIPFAEKMDGTFYYGELINALTDGVATSDITLYTTSVGLPTDGFTLDARAEIYESYTRTNSFGVQELLRRAYTGKVVRCGHIVGKTKATAVEYEATSIWSYWDGSSYASTDGTKIRQYATLVPTEPLTTYYIAAFAEMEDGTRYVREGVGEVETATVTTSKTPYDTDKGELKVELGYVDSTSATLYVTLVRQPKDTSFKNLTIKYSDYNKHLAENFVYGPALDPTKVGIKQKIELKNLTTNRKYYAKAYGNIIENTMDGYSDSISFDTIGANIRNTILETVDGKLNVISEVISIPAKSTITERGVCWALTKDILMPAASSQVKAIVDNPFGTFENTITGLSSFTTYYVKTYIKVSSTEFSGSRYYYSVEKEIRTTKVANTGNALRTFTLSPSNTTPTSTQVVMTVENPENLNIEKSGVVWRYNTNVGTMESLEDFNGVVEGSPLQPITLEDFQPRESIVIKSFVKSVNEPLVLSENEELLVFPVPPPIIYPREPDNPDIPITPETPDIPITPETPDIIDIDPTILPKPTPGRLVFPKNPVIGQKYYFKTKTWIWDGECWLNITSSNTSSNTSTVQTYSRVLLPTNTVGGTTLEGTNYIFIPANGTSEENFRHLREVYNSLEKEKKTIILLAPGQYGYGTPDQIEEEFVNINNTFLLTNINVSLVSLTGKADVEFLNLKTRISDEIIPVGAGNIPRNYLKIRGIKFINNNSELDYEVFSINEIPSFVLIENCEVDDNTSEAFVNNKGRIVNCISKAAYSFGGDHAATTEFIGCEGGDNSFNGSHITGLFRNCKAGSQSFGYENTIDIVNAEFYYCEGGDNSFGNSNIEVSDTKFINCRAGANSFMGNMENCYFENCYAEHGFSGPTIQDSTFTHCTAEASFSQGATATNTKYILCSSEMNQGYFSLGTNMGSVGQYTP